MTSFVFTTTTGDSGRVAAQIVTGIGFLGAGVILHGRRIVTGTTTAAVIWVTAAVGMAVGAGYLVAGIVLSIFINRLLVLAFMYETRWHRDLLDVCVTLDFEPRHGLTRVRIERVLVDHLLARSDAHWEQPSSDLGRLALHSRLARVHLTELLAELVEVPGVVAVVQDRCTPVHPRSTA